MKKKKKILISVTNRSSYNKVKTIVSNLPLSVEPTFLLGNSVNIYRFGGISHLIREDFPSIRCLKVHLAVDGDDLHKMSKTVGMGIIEIATILDNQHFDGVLTVADRFETMAIAIAASYANIPLFHLQGGEHTGTIDNKVRNAISQLADIHFPATDNAATNLFSCLPIACDDNIFNFGCPSMDLFHENEQLDLAISGKSDEHEILDLMDDTQHVINAAGTGDQINVKRPYVIVMFHADTTDKDFLKNIYHIRDAIDHIGIQSVVFWNNIDPGGGAIAKMWRERQIIQQNKQSKTRYIRHLQPVDFGAALYFSTCIIGNSSAGIRESSFIGTPSVNVGNRQNGREHAENCRTVSLNKTDIVDAIGYDMERKRPGQSHLYGDGHAGSRIAGRISDVLWNG